MTQNQIYKSSTYALNMCTIIKQCCDKALMHTLKKVISDCTVCKSGAELKTLSNMIKANWKSYVTLLEAVYCRLVLLNRRRPRELQRLLLQKYITSNQNENVQDYDEFSKALSETEKVLMKSFKRIVIRGKPGRGIPVFFNKEIEDQLNLVLKCRYNIIQKNNNYFLATRNPLNRLLDIK